MKVYTKIVIDIASGKVLEEEFFEYQGAVARCDFMEGESVEAEDVTTPEPGAGEQAFMDEQLQNMAQLYPELLTALGYRQTDQGLEQIPWHERQADMPPWMQEQYGLLGLRQERQRKALEGDFDVSPALERDIERLRRVGTEQITGQVGTRYLKSTAGGQALGRMNEAELIAREAARQAELTGGNQALLALMGGIGAQKGQQFGSLRSMYDPAGALQPFQQYAGLGLQANIAQSQLGVQADIASEQQRMENMKMWQNVFMGGGSSFGKSGITGGTA